MKYLLIRLMIAIHLVILFLMYSSPFWLDWRLICLMALINYLQILIFGGCILAKYQFKTDDIGFQEWLLGKIGVRVNHQKFKKFAILVLPFLIISAAIIWQVIFDISPLIGRL